MKEQSILNKVRELLGMEIKLEERKLDDGVTRIEADAFEPEAEVFIITEDDQRIALPIGEYKLEDGMILIVAVEGIIAEIKESVQYITINRPNQLNALNKQTIEELSAAFQAAEENKEVRVVPIPESAGFSSTALFRDRSAS